MDNVGSHINIVVKASKNTLRYSVPYRPKTNASETFIGYMKELLKVDQKALTFIELQQNIKNP